MVRRTMLVVGLTLTLLFPSRLDFTKTTAKEVEDLANACDVAGFGVNDKDVVDETYRKAGKLDRKHFALTFPLQSTGLLDIVGTALLEGSRLPSSIRAEPYKINVYGTQ